MKLFTTIAAAAVTFAAAPAQALPIWATVLAQSHCEYLVMGAGWKDALSQAYLDNSHWHSEIQRARQNNVAGTAILVEIQRTCPALEREAWTKFDASKDSAI